MARNADDSPGIGVVIWDPSTAVCYKDSVNYDYCAWGLDGNGETFFCGWDKDDVAEIRLWGTSYADKLYFWYDTGTNPITEYDLQNHSTTANMAGLMRGKDGADHMWGSRNDSSKFHEKQEGGDDSNYGGGGSDALNHGGSGSDDNNGEGGPFDTDECNDATDAGCEAKWTTDPCL